MSTKTLDAKKIAELFLAGAGELRSQKETINELNVFPVPDGDTGTNMTLTIMSAAKEVLSLGEDYSMEALCKAISMGSLRGARGNSGVILSQLLRGLTKVLKEYQEVDAQILAAAFNKATETAYKAVMKPKEGTILTVARGIAEKASEACDGAEDLESFAEEILKHGEEVLAKTPELLPVLKEAGVVDSGGQGLIAVLTGAKKAMFGEAEEFKLETFTSAEGASTGINRDAVANAEIKYGYCTEFIIMLNRIFNSKNEKDFKAYLESIGDSIVCVAMDDIVKVHVHTNHPGLAFEKALTFGALTSMKIDNMREEHQEKLFKLDGGKYVEKTSEEMDQSGPAGTANGPIPGSARNEPADPFKPVEGGAGTSSVSSGGKYGFLTVSAGSGMEEIFKGLGADEVISGGQTMNPSTDDLLKAVERVKAETIFILPNNKNIILAANQAAALTEDKKVVVIPTKTVPQGITAMINFIADLSPEENEETMKEEIARVKTGEVTYAVRDTMIDGMEIRVGDIMGIGDKAILSVGSGIMDVTMDMLSKLVTDDDSLISIYYGEETKKKEAEELLQQVEEAYPDLDVEMHEGGQPVYYYVVSVE